jgi:hypothetical protein
MIAACYAQVSDARPKIHALLDEVDRDLCALIFDVGLSPIEAVRALVGQDAKPSGSRSVEALEREGDA